MIIAVIDQPFEAVLLDAPVDLILSGLGVQLTVEVWDPSDGTSVVSATSVGIVEVRDGVYRKELTVDETGTFYVRWRTDIAGDITYADEALTVYSNLPASGPGLVPTVDELGALMRARTLVSGTEVGTFTANTRPTAEAAEVLLARAVDSVTARVGAAIPEALEGRARSVVLYRAAQLVEASYFPEQAEGEASAAEFYGNLFEESVTALEGTLRDNEATGSYGRMFSLPIVGIEGRRLTPEEELELAWWGE